MLQLHWPVLSTSWPIFMVKNAIATVNATSAAPDVAANSIDYHGASGRFKIVHVKCTNANNFKWLKWH